MPGSAGCLLWALLWGHPGGARGSTLVPGIRPFPAPGHSQPVSPIFSPSLHLLSLHPEGRGLTGSLETTNHRKLMSRRCGSGAAASSLERGTCDPEPGSSCTARAQGVGEGYVPSRVLYPARSFPWGPWGTVLSGVPAPGEGDEESGGHVGAPEVEASWSCGALGFLPPSAWKTRHREAPGWRLRAKEGEGLAGSLTGKVRPGLGKSWPWDVLSVPFPGSVPRPRGEPGERPAVERPAVPRGAAEWQHPRGRIGCAEASGSLLGSHLATCRAYSRLSAQGTVPGEG